jgi:exodeoxyribonuclease V alpha subunit
LVEPALAAHERMHSITLAPEQRAAVLTCVGAHLSLILGGAGTGKTSVLKALYATLEQIQPGVAIHQLALAGKAAQRMAEVTGRDAMTIAAFLVRIDSGQIAPGSLVVVDETSMVDVILMYRLLRHLPPDVRLVLVGDPAQLPPIGPGLVLHALAGVNAIPQVELSVVQRQSGASGIPRVAAAIRAHQAPEWTAYRGRATGVSFVPCAPEAIDDTVRRVYAELGGDGSDFSVQILCVTNAGFGGGRSLNGALHNRYREGGEPVLCHDEEFGTVGAATLDRVALTVGDLVIYTVNDYELGLRNGSLGRIVAALPAGGADDPCCLCDFDGIHYRLTTRQMQALSHAYAITVHKSQGSQFDRVIVPIRRTRLLDQALVYTAVTRAIVQVVLVGDEEAVVAAIRTPTSAAGRHVTLPTLLAFGRRD